MIENDRGLTPTRLWAVDFEKAGRKRHLDEFVLNVKRDEESLRKGNEDFVAFGGLYSEQWGSLFEAAMAIRGGGEVDVGDCADRDGLGRDGKIEDGAADEVADVVCIVIEFHALGCGHDDFEAGERLGGVDGFDSREVKDDTALVLADRKPVSGDLGHSGTGFRSSEVRWSEEDALLSVKAFGEVGEKFGEDLALTALGAEELCQDDPLRHLFRCWSVAVRDGVLRKVGW
jgi:hypothetical protein